MSDSLLRNLSYRFIIIEIKKFEIGIKNYGYI